MSFDHHFDAMIALDPHSDEGQQTPTSASHRKRDQEGLVHLLLDGTQAHCIDAAELAATLEDIVARIEGEDDEEGEGGLTPTAHTRPLPDVNIDHIRLVDASLRLRDAHPEGLSCTSAVYVAIQAHTQISIRYTGRDDHETDEARNASAADALDAIRDATSSRECCQAARELLQAFNDASRFDAALSLGELLDQMHWRNAPTKWLGWGRRILLS
ncbi:hypothetical protein PENSPDRAFT_670076 [Peniophora sp. CONT]|nr:hypothetical protein PENSPDRAFT_670076 [Peniophora sp. CONT]